ncbi:sulfotransferase family protein [Roseovarius aestuariivivens]|uniref:sulfotransferase family protein n=1 Tax=Roseovarius aestuariivivens TaxID=1888910 RepID=UPI00108088D0|nr:sulfotransferase family protein [Roseovarius aestuariivivens]
MTLQIIGSGFGRTGTKSLKAAIERLGFTPCHHMHEVVENPAQVAHWQAIAEGRPVDWEAVFAGYAAQVDWPGAHVWRELAESCPEARIIHSVRPEDKWWASFERTIAKLLTLYRDLPLPPHIRDMMDAFDRMVVQTTFAGKITDKATALAAYRQREADVRAALPPERLLVFDVAQGWDPLCDFLGLPAPDEPFPHHNLRADFWEVLGGEPA